MFGIINEIDGYLTDSEGNMLTFVSPEEADDYLAMIGITNGEAYGFTTKLLA